MSIRNSAVAVDVVSLWGVCTKWDLIITGKGGGGGAGNRAVMPPGCENGRVTTGRGPGPAGRDFLTFCMLFCLFLSALVVGLVILCTITSRFPLNS